MIQLPAKNLSRETNALLSKYQADVDAKPGFAGRVELAARKFKQANRRRSVAFTEVKTVLNAMCMGARRCMYCEDSAADEVEHHHPKDFYPEYVFVWWNYLYACGPCNGTKNSRFALFKDEAVVELIRRRGEPSTPPFKGKAVLLHPRTENPLDYLMLDIAGGTFLFVPKTSAPSREFSRAEYTIRILRLNDRDYLPAARREAYESYKARVGAYGLLRNRGVGDASLDTLVRAVGRMVG